MGKETLNKYKMQTIRYTGEDIAIDIVMNNDDGTLIDPTTLDAIYVYLVNQDGNTVEKYAEPAKEGYEPITVTEAKASIWIQSDLTKTLAGNKLHIELNIEQTVEELSDRKQNSIVLSDEILIKDANIKAES
jgi:hypothetical protein